MVSGWSATETGGVTARPSSRTSASGGKPGSVIAEIAGCGGGGGCGGSARARSRRGATRSGRGRASRAVAGRLVLRGRDPFSPPAGCGVTAQDDHQAQPAQSRTRATPIAILLPAPARTRRRLVALDSAGGFSVLGSSRPGRPGTVSSAARRACIPAPLGVVVAPGGYIGRCCANPPLGDRAGITDSSSSTVRASSRSRRSPPTPASA